jgi:hypothetical protein
MAILSFTYTTLVAALKDQLENDDTEFDAFAPTVVAQGEQHLCDDLDLHLFDGEDTGSFVIGTGLIARPADAVDLQTVWLTDALGAQQLIEERTLEFCRAYWPNFTSQGTPKYWAPASDDEIRVVPTPSATLAWRIVSTKRPTGLSPTQATSWFGTHAGDALFYACLLKADQFHMAAENLTVWQESYELAKARLLPTVAKLRRARYGAAGG